MTRMKQASVLFATARAHRVLPVPGGPNSNTPLGGSMPRFTNFSGYNTQKAIFIIMLMKCFTYFFRFLVYICNVLVLILKYFEYLNVSLLNVHQKFQTFPKIVFKCHIIFLVWRVFLVISNVGWQQIRSQDEKEDITLLGSKNADILVILGNQCVFKGKKGISVKCESKTHTGYKWLSRLIIGTKQAATGWNGEKYFE